MHTGALIRPPLSADKVTAAAAAVGLIGLFLPFLGYRETRIASAVPRSLWDNTNPVFLTILLVLLLSPVIVMFFDKDRFAIMDRIGKVHLLGILGNFLIVAVFFITAQTAGRILAAGGAPHARISIGAGAWLLAFSGYLHIMNAAKKLEASRIDKYLINFLWIAAIIALFAAGIFNSLSIVQEYNVRKSRFFQELLNHITIASVSVGIALLLGIPAGMLAYRNKAAGPFVFTFVNTIQTVPSLALFGLLIAPLSYVSQNSEFLRTIGIRGIGRAPAVIALTLYALLPITRNTYTSLKNLAASTLEAGTAMGMSRFQRLRIIELPLAVPVIASGIRTAMVQVIGNTTVAALIGAGGLGFFVFQGFGQAAPDMILLGAIPVIVLAVAVDRLMRAAIKLITPKGIGHWLEGEL